MMNRGRGSSHPAKAALAGAGSPGGGDEPLNASGVGCFAGDEDIEAARMQEETYSDAVGVIVDACNSLTRFAKRLLEDSTHPDWGEISRFDRDAFQRPHAMLAATWRCRNDLLQLDLPLENPKWSHVHRSLRNRWIWWLREEVEGWINTPSLIENVQIILTQPNKASAYLAESNMCLRLYDRFSDVPWRRGLWEALSRCNDRDIQQAAEWGSKSVRVFPGAAIPSCECTQNRRPPCNQIPCKTTIVRAAREGWGPLE